MRTPFRMSRMRVFDSGRPESTRPRATYSHRAQLRPVEDVVATEILLSSFESTPTRPGTGSRSESHSASSNATPAGDARREDEGLMRAIAKRDPTALAGLYDRHRGAVFGICLRILGPGPDAEEVLEDVFMEVWRRPERYRSGASGPLVYLVVLARSRAIDRLRALRRQRDGRDRWAVATQSASEPAAPGTPLRDALDAEARVLAGDALAVLSADERRAVELAFWQGLTHSEIAQRLDEPLGTVKTRIRRGLARLRAALRDLGPGGER